MCFLRTQTSVGPVAGNSCDRRQPRGSLARRSCQPAPRSPQRSAIWISGLRHGWLQARHEMTLFHKGSAASSAISLTSRAEAPRRTSCARPGSAPSARAVTPSSRRDQDERSRSDETSSRYRLVRADARRARGHTPSRECPWR